MAIHPIALVSATPPARPSPRARVRAPSPASAAASETALLAEPKQAEPEAAATYEVGYKKPPAHTQFQPGRSGNPRGRRKGSKGLRTLIRESLSEMVIARTATGEKKISRIEGLIHKSQELAMKGNVRAIANLLSLYAAAVPDAPESSEVTLPEDLSATDQAILEAFMASIHGQEDSQ